MICPNCKVEIPDDCAFCPNCGNPVKAEQPAALSSDAEEAQAPEVTVPQPAETSGKSRKGLIIGICAAVVALAVAGIAVFGSNPLVKVQQAAKNTMDARSAKLKEVSKQMTAAVSCDLQALTADLLGVELPAGAEIVLASDAEKQASSLKASVSVNDHSFLDASAMIGKSGLVISSDALLGEAYGIDFSKVKENLPGSVLDPAKGYVTQEQYDSFVESIDHREDTVELTKDLSELVNSVAGVVFRSVEKNSDAKAEKAKVDFGGTEVAVTQVNVDINREQLDSIFDETVNYLKNDAQFRNDLEEVSRKYSGLIETVSGVSADELLAQFYAKLDEYKKPESYAGRNGKEPWVDLVFCINSSKELIGARFCAHNEDIEIEFKLGPDAAAPTYFFARFFELNGEKANFTYRISENNTSVYAASAALDIEGVITESADINWNKTSGDLTVSCGDMVFAASVTKADDVVTIAPQSISGAGLDEYSDYLRMVTVTVSPKAEIAEDTAFRELLSMSEEDIQSVVEEVVGAFYTSLYSLLF